MPHKYLLPCWNSNQGSSFQTYVTSGTNLRKEFALGRSTMTYAKILVKEKFLKYRYMRTVSTEQIFTRYSIFATLWTFRIIFFIFSNFKWLLGYIWIFTQYLNLFKMLLSVGDILTYFNWLPAVLESIKALVSLCM